MVALVPYTPVQNNIEFDAESGRLNGVPLLGGLLAGVSSFVAGYLAFVGIAAGTGDSIDFNVESLQQVGLLFYNSIRVPTQMQGVRPFEDENGQSGEFVDDFWYNPFFDSDTVEHQNSIFLQGDLVESSTETIQTNSVETFVGTSLSFPAPVYLAIPVAILFVAGVAFAYLFIRPGGRASGQDLLVRSVVGGVTLTMGFLLFALVGLYGFVLEDTLLYLPGLGVDPQFTRADRQSTLIYASLYPAVVGTAGVFAGQLLHKVRTPEEDERIETADATREHEIAGTTRDESNDEVTEGEDGSGSVTTDEEGESDEDELANEADSDESELTTEDGANR